MYQLKNRSCVVILSLALSVLLHITLSYVRLSHTKYEVESVKGSARDEHAFSAAEVGSLININDAHARDNEKRFAQVGASSCRRRCPHFNNRIIIELPVSTLHRTTKAGLLDRAYIMRAWANVGLFLCAKVKIPSPSSWLTAKHNSIGNITSSMSFEKDFLYFVDVDDPDQTILSDTIDVQEDGWGLQLNSVVAEGRNDAHKVIEHFFQANEFTKRQELSGELENSTEQQHFLWKVRGRYHQYNMHFLKFLYGMKERSNFGSSAIAPTQQIPKWERYEDDLCVYASKRESTSIQQTARHVIQKLKIRFGVRNDEPLKFGYLHVRRGDTMKTEGDTFNKQLCDTTIPKMARYLDCTFHRNHFNNITIPLLVGSDETDAKYRKRLFSLINAIPGLEAVDLDKEVLNEIDNEIASGSSPPHKRNNYSVFLASLAIIEDASFYLRQHRVWCNDCDAHLISLDNDESAKWWSNGWLPVDWSTGLDTYQKGSNPFMIKGAQWTGARGGHHGSRPVSTQGRRLPLGGRPETASHYHGTVYRTTLSNVTIQQQRQRDARTSSQALLKNPPACGVLVTSQGGVGSSFFLKHLSKLVRTNDFGDRDTLKHKAASCLQRHDSSSITFESRCFNKVLVIIGDPLHTIESTHRRFGVKHLNKLKKGCASNYYRSGSHDYKKGTTLNQIYSEMLDAGKDLTGIDEYVHSWYKASQDRSSWPEIKLVTSPMLFDNAVNYAKWLGVNDGDLHKFSGYSFDLSKMKSMYQLSDGGSSIKTSNSERRERVMALLENVTNIISLVENSTSYSTDRSMTISQNSWQDQRSEGSILGNRPVHEQVGASEGSREGEVERTKCTFCEWDKPTVQAPEDLNSSPKKSTEYLSHWPPATLWNWKGQCSFDGMTNHYSTCKTMLTNDENCTDERYDARGYYSSAIADKAYLPLGPRYDSWKSFVALVNQGSMRLPPSKRKFAFNAIFSKSTSEGRATLEEVIQKEGDSLSSFIQISPKWRGNPNSASNSLADTTTYMQALLDSTFTLSPAGHNPECFRLYEAVEAGSIPVIALDKEYKQHACKDSLSHWIGSPIVIVESWNEIIPTLQRMLENPAELDKRQADLRAWYNQHMRNVVQNFETFLLS